MNNISNYNNYNNYNTSFYGKPDNKENNVEESLDTKALINTSADYLHELAERQVPENNKFRKLVVAFDIPNTPNEAFLSVSHDEIQPKDMRRMAIEVHHANSDKYYTRYLFKGTKKEVMDYILKEENQKEMLKAVNELSKKVDELYN